MALVLPAVLNRMEKRPRFRAPRSDKTKTKTPIPPAFFPGGLESRIRYIIRVAMDAKERKALLEYLKSQIRIVADYGLAHSLLDDFAKTGKSPRGWKEELEELRRSPEYVAFVTTCERMLEEFDKSGSESDLAALLQKISSKLPN